MRAVACACLVGIVILIAGCGDGDPRNRAAARKLRQPIRVPEARYKPVILFNHIRTHTDVPIIAVEGVPHEPIIVLKPNRGYHMDYLLERICTATDMRYRYDAGRVLVEREP